MNRRLLSILLTICMLVGLLPTAAIPVRADDDAPAISLGMSDVAKGDTIYFGENDDGPIEWLVLSPADDKNLPSGEGDVLVISKYVIKGEDDDIPSL